MSPLAFVSSDLLKMTSLPQRSLHSRSNSRGNLLRWWAMIGLVAGAMTLSATDVFGASVLNKRKKRMVVVIDEGAKSGVNQGDSVCFFDLNDTELGCGKVRRVRPNRSFVKVKAPLFRKIRKGFVASYGSGGGDGGMSSGGPIVRIRPVFGGMFKQPYTSYLPKHGKNMAPYWQKSDDNALHNLVSGFAGVEVEAAPFNTSAGFRMDVITDGYEGTQDYTYEPGALPNCRPKPEAVAEQEPLPCHVDWTHEYNSFGGYLQFMYPVPLDKDIYISVGGGLDINYSILSFTALQLNDNDQGTNTAKNLLKDVDSKLLSIGARLPASVHLNLGSTFGIYLGGAVIVAFFGEAEISDYTTQDVLVAKSANQAKDKRDYVTKYFADALDHGPNVFGASLQGGIQLSF